MCPARGVHPGLRSRPSLARIDHVEPGPAGAGHEAEWRLNRIATYEVAHVVAQRIDGTDDEDPDRWLPHPEETDRIVRYEAHLNRLFYQALHELEAQQARRRGQAAPLARVDVHGLADA